MKIIARLYFVLFDLEIRLHKLYGYDLITQENFILLIIGALELMKSLF